MTWQILETVDEVKEVVLEGGHTAKLRPLTPGELARADRSVSPLRRELVMVLRTIEDGAALADLSPEQREAHDALEAASYDRLIARLGVALLELDGRPVDGFKALLSRIRPVSEAAALVVELGGHLSALMDLPAEKKS